MILPKVSIIIVNWNGWRDTVECLESLGQITYSNYEVILVDNGSTDESLLRLKEYADGTLQAESPFFTYSPNNKPITIFECTKEEAESTLGTEGSFLSPKEKLIVIKNGQNYGFAEGSNIGIRIALARESSYVLLLNNDVVVDASFLTELVLASERDERIGFAGPKVYFYNYSGRADVINFAGGVFCVWTGSARHIGLKQIDQGQFNKMRLVDFIEGSCILARTEAIWKTGFLRADYFAYWEDVEWCLRGAELGYKAGYVSKARIWHKVGASKKEKSISSYYYDARNLLWLVKSHASVIQLVFFLSYLLVFKIWVKMGVSIVFHRSISEAISLLKGTVDGFRVPVN
jgi:GT2 family glycosyltransferase